ncbi:transglycosylase family protein [Paenarthrobacter sp. CCNWLY172]|uniref:Transglycosylase family protein n=1 Tax=Paenarthrobacter sp. AMU7 TaxID=3162492 RepID=A0AB39YV35_9MICC|nr:MULTISPECIES: resuscitation-promoting factor [Micrococcaceae]QSZ48212.1 transglycosylase [Arthrobacter sp. D5-1]WGM21940.1 transglycosylase family protein [Paenarthrobacter sp. OM7]
MIKFFTTDGKFSFLKVGAQLLVVAALVVGVVAFVGNNKTVTLNVDGKVSSIQTFGGTVDQVVKAAKVELKDADRVSPALDARVDNGSVVNINLAKAVSIELDGARKTVNTNAPDVAALVSELGVASSSEISQPKEASLEVTGSFVSISTPKTISVVADGKDTTTTTTAADVATVLKDTGVTVGANDRISQPGNAPIVQDMVIKVSRVDTSKTAEATEEVPFESVKTETAELFKGEEKVTQEGVAGSLVKTFKLVLVDGREASRALVSSNVTTKPVTEKVSVGTKARPVAAPAKAAATSSGPTGAPNEAMWDRIAQCESGGNWSINTGNGYYGGLQFSSPTWLANGGGAYAPNASLATKAQQIDIANRLYAKNGLRDWGCAHAA